MIRFDLQAVGELLTLCTLLDETKNWAKPMLQSQLAAAKNDVPRYSPFWLGRLMQLDGINSAVLTHTAHPPVLDLDFAIVVAPTPIQLGDVNLDGTVNLLDVHRFADLVSSNGFQNEADLNQDGNVDNLDVPIFVSALLGKPL